tara:strand:+ start:44652 stop:45617 length:966 start_codon:yes stop_codon:yes gene_type:complete
MYAEASRMRQIFTLIIGLLIALPGFAQDNNKGRWLEGKSDGWFWYNEPEEVIEEPVEEEPKPQTTVISPPPAPQGPAPLSSAWIRENMQSYLDAAIDNPTPENVSAFLYIQRYAMDKSFAFMDAQQQVTLGHPVFDEINRRPTATFANRKLDDEASSNNSNVISKISANSGLFFFFDGSEASMAQLGVLDMLVRNHKFDIVKISVAPIPETLKEQGIRVDNGHGAQMGVTTVPAIVMVRPDGVFDIISQAPVSLNDLKKRILVGAKRLAVISEDEFNSTRPINNINLNLADSQPKPLQPLTNTLPIPAKDIVNAFSGDQTR